MNRAIAPTLAALLPAALLFAGCKPKPAQLNVEPPAITFGATGEVIILQPSVLDAEGERLETGTCAYFTSNEKVAEVRQDGTVVAAAGGKAELRVSCSGLSTQVPVNVRLPARVALEPACAVRCEKTTSEPVGVKLEGIGAAVRLVATVQDDEGKPMEVPVTFEGTDPSYTAGGRKLGIEVGKDGTVKALSEGRFLVMASAGNVSGKIDVEVVLPVVDVVQAPRALTVAPGAQADLGDKAFQRTKGGLKQVRGARMGYRSENPAVAKVDDEGKVTGVAQGKTTVIAAADSGAYAQVTVVVGTAVTQKAAPVRSVKKLVKKGTSVRPSNKRVLRPK